jgi:predicted esterase YcpF (UPF0227 family)
MTLKEFFSIYVGEGVDKITKEFLDDFGLDFLYCDDEDNVWLLNSNIDNTFTFTQRQEEYHGYYDISWRIGDKEFEVESMHEF